MGDVRFTGTMRLLPGDWDEAEESLRQAVQNAVGHAGVTVIEAEESEPVPTPDQPTQ